MADVTTTYTIGPAAGKNGDSETVEGKVVVTCTRTSATSATITMTAQFRRTVNNGYTTEGTTVVNYYKNGSVVSTKSVSIACSNDTWVTHSSYSFTETISEGALEPKILTSLGFDSTCAATDNLDMSYTISNNVSIPAYATACGAPTFTLTDDDNGTVTVTVTKGADGTNNTATYSRIYYSFTKSDIDTSNYDAYLDVDHTSLTTNSKTIAYTSDNDVLYVRAQSLATYGMGESVSSVRSIQLSDLEPDYNGAPTSVICVPIEGTSKITVVWSGASAGSNNSICGYKFQYSASNTLIFKNWVDSIDFESTGTYGEATFQFSPDYRYYALRCKTLSSVSSEYDSSWSTYGATSNANYQTGARVKENSEWVDYVAHIVKDSVWMQCANAVGGVVNAVTLSDGAALTETDGEQIYSLEYKL